MGLCGVGNGMCGGVGGRAFWVPSWPLATHAGLPEPRSLPTPALLPLWLALSSGTLDLLLT